MNTLILDKIYQPIAFVSERKMIKLLYTNRVEVVSEWDDQYFYQDLKYPAVMILKSYIRKKPVIPKFHRKGIFIRDGFQCQYTGEQLNSNNITIDHVIPKSRGGKTSWENCVAASFKINAFKGNRTPEEAGLKLFSKPFYPKDQLYLEYFSFETKHHDWMQYFSQYG